MTVFDFARVVHSLFPEVLRSKTFIDQRKLDSSIQVLVEIPGVVPLEARKHL